MIEEDAVNELPDAIPVLTDIVEHDAGDFLWYMIAFFFFIIYPFILLFFKDFIIGFKDFINI